MRPVATLQVAMADSVAPPESTKYLNLNALTSLVIVAWDHILKPSTSEDFCEPRLREEGFEQFLAWKYVQRRAQKN